MATNFRAEITDPKPNSGDSYWKTDYSLLPQKKLLQPLQDAGYEHLSGMSRKQLSKVVARMVDRHLICYYKCTDAELKTFVKARGLKLVELVKKPLELRKRYGRIKALYEADGAPQFERFLELPPELRNEVYALYMSDFPDKLKAPKKPPLARTCKAMMTEVSSVFYSRHVFSLTFFRRTITSQKDIPAPFVPDQRTGLFLLGLSPDNAGHIRRLEMCYEQLENLGRSKPNTRVLMRCEISLDAEDGKFRRVSAPSNWDTEYHRSVEKAGNGVVEEIVGRKDGGRLRVPDFHALRTVVEKAGQAG